MNRLPVLRGKGFAVSRDLNPKLVSVDALKPLGRQTRKHPQAQIRKLGESLEQFGFVVRSLSTPRIALSAAGALLRRLGR
jgi:hypothetical protein